MDPLELLDEPEDAQGAALIALLRRQTQRQGVEREALRDTLGRQQGQAGGLRALSLLSSMGDNPLLRGIQRTSGEQGAQMEGLAARTEGRLAQGEGDPVAPLRAMLEARRLKQKGESDAAKLGLAEKKLAEMAARHRAGAAAAATKAEKKAQSDAITRETGFRKELQLLPEVKEFAGIENAYNTLKKAAKDPSGSAGVTTIFSFMKMIDPGVAVMEGDVDRIRAAGGPAAKLANLYQQALSGNPLPESVRQDLVRQADNVYQTRMETANARKAQYRRLAEKAGVDPDSVAPLASTKAADVPAAPARSAQDEAALKWARENPKDPRATAILQRLGVTQ